MLGYLPEIFNQSEKKKNTQPFKKRTSWEKKNKGGKPYYLSYSAHYPRHTPKF